MLRIKQYPCPGDPQSGRITKAWFSPWEARNLSSTSGIPRASLIAQLVKNPCAMQETLAQFQVRKIPWRRDRLPTPVFLGFPGGSAGKESTRNVGDLGSIPGLGRPPGEGKGYPFQYSGLENSRMVQSMGSQRAGHGWATCNFTFQAFQPRRNELPTHLALKINGKFKKTVKTTGNGKLTFKGLAHRLPWLQNHHRHSTLVIAGCM